MSAKDPVHMFTAIAIVVAFTSVWGALIYALIKAPNEPRTHTIRVTPIHRKPEAQTQEPRPDRFEQLLQAMPPLLPSMLHYIATGTNEVLCDRKNWPEGYRHAFVMVQAERNSRGGFTASLITPHTIIDNVCPQCNELLQRLRDYTPPKP